MDDRTEDDDPQCSRFKALMLAKAGRRAPKAFGTRTNSRSGSCTELRTSSKIARTNCS